jgi:hypothetical protein
MDDYFDRVERQLGQLTEQGKHRRASRVRLPQLRRAAAAGAFVASVAVVLVVAAVLLSTIRGHGPAAPSPPPAGTPLLPARMSEHQREQLRYVFRAESTVWQPNPRCAIRLPGSATPSTSQGVPARALLSALAVLRRAADATDALPNHAGGPDLNGLSVQRVFVRFIRRARWRFGAGYYVIPAANANTLQVRPASCYRHAERELRRELPTIPASLRAGMVELALREFATERHNSRPYPGVCLAALNSLGGGYVSCNISDADIKNGKAVNNAAPNGFTTLYGLVPDDVAAVTLDFPAGTVTRHHGKQHVHVAARSITARVISNMFIVLQPTDGIGFPSKMIWRSASGSPIKTIHGF